MVRHVAGSRVDIYLQNRHKPPANLRIEEAPRVAGELGSVQAEKGIRKNGPCQQIMARSIIDSESDVDPFKGKSVADTESLIWRFKQKTALQPLIYYVQAVKSRSVWISGGNLLGHWTWDRKLQPRARLHTSIRIRVIFHSQGRYARRNGSCGFPKGRSSEVFQMNCGYLICCALGGSVCCAHEHEKGCKYHKLGYLIFHDDSLLFRRDW